MAGGVGELSRICRDGLFLRKRVPADAAALMDNCLSLGLNSVIAQVRPFGDALYRSSLFPWSHLCTGVQGQDPGFDRWTCC